MKVLISAAEVSSDIHGAKLLESLRALDPGLRAYGIGGPELQAAGLEPVVDARELLVIGYTEVLGRLGRIKRALDQIVAKAAADRPDVAVVIDYPEFHFRLAARLKEMGIPVIYYIPPKVWVWRSHRIRRLAEGFAKVLCIFPFEPEFYAARGGAATFVGNPLLDELPLSLTRAEARSRLGLQDSDKVLAFLPGSRPAELKYHLEVGFEGILRAAARLRSQGVLAPESALQVCIPVPKAASLDAVRARVAAWGVRFGASNANFPLRIQVTQGNSHDVLKAADSGLIKSGTSTLEAALLGCPHVLFYKPSWLAQGVFKLLMRYHGPVGLTNIVDPVARGGGERVVPEVLCEQVTPEQLSVWVEKLLTDVPWLEQMKRRLSGLGTSLKPPKGTSVAGQVAIELRDWVRARGVGASG